MSFDSSVPQPAPLFGIAGWSNSGKTTLIEKLAGHFAQRGLRVATIKHTHHKFDIDAPGSDTARHRAAGAAETAIVSGSRVAIIEEIETAGEPALDAVAARLEPADIILVEGYKSAAIPKIEVRRAAVAHERLLAASDPHVLAIAADYELDAPGKAVFNLDDVVGIAELIEKALGSFKSLRHRA
ncbi:molybdopterin-guanine dinucleotide biosynthesis protein B [Hyphomicrobium sp.]|jgi:molybdopterin-guanine dinucleotide biosynthesis protein B|uniref:molybdopterin-guanine dinucleotide biosynthesis protein B n=1 Tax=Hyphomicrobium sp. TaxID=82 RepID=UPI002D071F6F|nr:molybdopterin-guanine dinucleotide biosynthesis protein B [Hyphomicrobium sp.]HVZ06075.1 molybdopterin-guanine dinucleotide biosynthesis protein B [Hyphomicrobium sp.]